MHQAVQLFSIYDLPHPPANYEFNGIPDTQWVRYWRLREWRALVSYHDFGYRDLPRANARRQDYLHVIKRIFYSRFQTQMNLRLDLVLYTTGDVGPGTIPADLRQRHNIADHYLTEEAAWRLLRPAEYLKTPLAGRFRSHAILIDKYATTRDWSHADHSPLEPMLEHKPEQNQYPFSQPKLTMSSILSVEIGPQMPARGHDNVIPPHRTGSTTATRTAKPELTVTIPAHDHRPGAHLLSDMSQELRGDLYQELHDHLFQELRPALDQDLRRGQFQELRQDLYQEIRQDLVQELRQEIRCLLPKETHSGEHQEPPSDAYRPLSPVSELDGDTLRRANDSRHGIAQIRLAIQYNPWAYAETRDGELYPHHGQGPTWSQNSCAWDSIIVAMVFLNNAGINIGDLVENPDWRPEQHAFLKLVALEWMKLGSQRNARRDGFIQLYAAEYNKRNAIQYKIGGMQSVLRLWEDITDNIGHFSYYVNRITQSCACRQSEPEIGHRQKRSNVTDWTLGFASGITEATDLDLLLENSFRRPQDDSTCRLCQRPRRTTRYVINGEPPQYLIMALDIQCTPRRHTRTLRIPYDKLSPPSEGSTLFDEFEASYEWLFGIYVKTIPTEDGVGFPHFSFFCDDLGASEGTPRFIHYDDSAANGAIVGGLQDPSRRPDDRIPQSWMEICPPLICYRLIGTSRTDIGTSLNRLAPSSDKAVGTDATFSSDVVVELPASPGSGMNHTNAERGRLVEKSSRAPESYSKSVVECPESVAKTSHNT